MSGRRHSHDVFMSFYMQKYLCLQFRNSTLHGSRISVEFLSKLLDRYAVNKPTFSDSSAAFRMNVFFYDARDVTIGIVHAFTRPEPLQVGHFLYPELPPVLRVRFLVVTLIFCFAMEVTTYDKI